MLSILPNLSQGLSHSRKCTKTIKTIGDQDKPLKVVQRLLINTVGGRDYSAQETCHLLLQLPLYMASRDFIILGTDGTRAVENNLDVNNPATALSILDHYHSRPTTTDMTLYHFAQNYTMSKNQNIETKLL